MLIYDDFRNDNAGTVRRVLDFLEVHDMPPIEPVRTRPLPAIRSLTLHQLGRAVRLARRERGYGKGPRTPGSGGPSRLSSLWKRAVYKPALAPDESFMIELRRRYKDEVLALSEYIDRDLVSLWGYDRLE